MATEETKTRYVVVATAEDGTETIWGTEHGAAFQRADTARRWARAELPDAELVRVMPVLRLRKGDGSS